VIPLNGDTPFEIGSITKTFASTIFLRRHRSYDGLLGDFIKNVLPVRMANIPIHNLTNYSPGMPPDNHGPIWWNGIINADSVEDLANTLAGKTFIPHCQPGRHFTYSNFGWGLVGMAGVGVENIHDRPLQKWQHEIAELGHALGFSNTTQPAFPAARTILPAGYSESGLLPESTTYDRATWNTLFGGGDLISNGDDMYRWLLFNMGRLNPDIAFLHKQQDPTFTWLTKQNQVHPDVHTCVTEATPHPVVTSMAWFHHSLKTPAVTYLWKDGGVAGFTSWMGFKQWIDSGQPSDVGMFVLTNQAGAADILGPQILEILLHAEGAAPPSEQLGDEFPGLG
jgi:CubicO group peptidase (beta-lactamase class C family)